MTDPQHKELYRLFSSIRDQKDAERLLRDLLSPAEINYIAKRWQIMRSVAAGVSHRTIAKAARTSIAKVSRCARVMRYENGALAARLKKLQKKNIRM